ncbi:LysM peptidoglycan-binding domain-containing protein [Rathayibacter sp. CAU 1779]
MTTFVLTQQRLPVRVRTRLTRRGRVVIAALILLPLLIGIGTLAANGDAIAGAVGTSSTAFHHVTVRSGDSLWSIAERLAPQSDPRDVVAAIVDLNGLQSSVLQSGQQLAVPHEYDGR